MRHDKNWAILGVIAVAMAAAWLPSQQAVAHGNGILVQVLDEKIVIGFENDEDPSGQPILGVQAFSSVLSANDASQDPSFASYTESNPQPPPAGTLPLPAGEDLYWDFLPMTIAGVTSNLFYWEGLGTIPEEVNFVANPHPDVTMGLYNLEEIPGVWSTVDGAGQMVPGALIGTTDALGNDLRLHNHLLWYALDDGDGSAETHPPDGIYLFAMQLRMAGLTTSDPFFIASKTLDTDLTALVSAAMPWIEEHADTLIIPGDYDFDGVVDGTDFLAWQRQYGSSGPFPIDGAYADGDGSGVVDAGDLVEWGANFGATGFQPISHGITAFPIPEPSPQLLLAFACGAVMLMRGCRPRSADLLISGTMR